MAGKIDKHDYSAVVVEHAKHPRNMGSMKNPDALGIAGGPCGDETEFFIKIGKKKEGKKEVEFIEDIKFETMGCAAAIATASMVTETVKGKPLDEAVKISREELVKKLGGMPLVKLHCIDLTVNAIRNTIENYQKRKK